MNFLQSVARAVAVVFAVRAVNRHGVSMLRVLGAIIVAVLVIGWLYS